MAKVETASADLFAEEAAVTKKKVGGLIIALVGIGIVLVFSVLWALNPSYLDGLTAMLQGGYISSLADIMLSVGNFIGYGVAIICLIVVLMYLSKGTRQKVAPIAKYAGLVVLTFAFSVGLVGFLLGGFDNLFGSGLSLWWMLGLGSSWPAYSILVAASTISVPLCFNRAKTRIWEVLTLIGVVIYIYFVATSTAGNFYSAFDIIWGIFISVGFAGFLYKSVLAIPDQERWDTDKHVLTPMHDAYKRVLMAKAILEERPIKVVKQVETPEGMKEEVTEEIPSGTPEDFVKQAIRLYSETETVATEYGDQYAREVKKSQIWQKRLARILEERQLVESGEMDETLYKQRWLYIF